MAAGRLLRRDQLAVDDYHENSSARRTQFQALSVILELAENLLDHANRTVQIVSLGAVLECDDHFETSWQGRLVGWPGATIGRDTREAHSNDALAGSPVEARLRPAYSSVSSETMISTWSASTWSPGSTRTEVMVPDEGARTECSIFIASITTSTAPGSTC